MARANTISKTPSLSARPRKIKSSAQRTIYSIEVEGIRIAFLGPIKQTQLTDEQKEMLENSDIVLIPVGGKQILDFEMPAQYRHPARALMSYPAQL